MLNLTRMTARYDEHEDRISLTADSESEKVVRLWLTRALTRKLVPALVNVVKPHHDDPAYAEMIDSFAQQKAEESHMPPQPVAFPARQGIQSGGENSQYITSKIGLSAPVISNDEWLVREIQVNLPKDSVVLTFSGAHEDQRARCGFSTETMRQWLAILRRVCLKAGWTSPDWPEWMQGSANKAQSAASLH